jgi:hypothetical protein
MKKFENKIFLGQQTFCADAVTFWVMHSTRAKIFFSEYGVNKYQDAEFYVGLKNINLPK